MLTALMRRFGRTGNTEDPAPPGGWFFDRYPKFYQTSRTAAARNRLNRRHMAIIEAHQPQLRDQRVLDIASHDGRWSFAALERGAAHVMGIEGRKEMVKKARNQMKRYEVAPERYSFVVGDIHRKIAALEPGQFDTVMCLGFFYHTPHHYFLLSEIKRLNPKWLIMDTAIAPHRDCVISMYEEDADAERNAIATSGRRSALVGSPSLRALDLMLANLGFSATYFDWHDANIRDWRHLQDYREGRRVTLLAQNVDYEGA